MARPRSKVNMNLDPSLARLEPRERLLVCARDLFQAKGFEGVNIRELMQEADVNQTTIYYYFQSKDGLFLATLLDLLEELDQEFSLALREPTFQASLKALASLFTDLPAPNLSLLFSGLQERVDLNRQKTDQGITSQQARPAFLYVNQTWPRGLENLLKEAHRNGEIGADQPAFLAHYILTLLSSYPHSPFNGSSRPNADFGLPALLKFINSTLKADNFSVQI